MKTLLIVSFLFLSFSSHAFNDAIRAYKLASEGKAILIDVREADEVKEGMVKDAKWFPLSRLETPKEKWVGDFLKMIDGKEIFVYCRTGKRSEKAKNILQNTGISSKNIGGWETLKETLPTTKK